MELGLNPKELGLFSCLELVSVRGQVTVRLCWENFKVYLTATLSQHWVDQSDQSMKQTGHQCEGPSSLFLL